MPAQSQPLQPVQGFQQNTAVGKAHSILILVVMIVVIVIAVVVLLIIFKYLKPFGTVGAGTVTVNGENIYVSVNSGGTLYNSSSVGYVYYTPNKGSLFNPSLTLDNYYYNNVTVENISIITPGFKLQSVSPALPIMISYGSSVTFGLQAIAPSKPYNGTIDILVKEKSMGYSYYTTTTIYSYNYSYITGLNLQINYSSPNSDYFGSTTQFINESYYTYSDYNNGTFTLPILVRNRGNATHEITGLEIHSPGFKLLNTNPTLPYGVGGSNGTVQLLATIQAPRNQNFTGPVYIVLDTK